MKNTFKKLKSVRYSKILSLHPFRLKENFDAINGLSRGYFGFMGERIKELEQKYPDMLPNNLRANSL